MQTIAEQIASYTERQTDGVDYASDFAQNRSNKNAEAINAKTAASQEIGPLPDIANQQRRERASAENLNFAETYFP